MIARLDAGIRPNNIQTSIRSIALLSQRPYPFFFCATTYNHTVVCGTEEARRACSRPGADLPQAMPVILPNEAEFDGRARGRRRRKVRSGHGKLLYGTGSLRRKRKPSGVSPGRHS